MFRGMPLLAAALCLPLATLGQPTHKAVAIPKDPLELVTGGSQIVDTPQKDAIELLTRARNNQAIRGGNQGYDIKVSFTVSSGGQTEYDGDWEMEEIHVPRLGTRWTAMTAGGYSTTEITSDGLTYGEGTASTMPLRLHEARAALFGAAATIADGNRIRSATATYNGVKVMCLLLAGTERLPAPGAGRRWDETEECIDPQTGWLHVHSQVPGRYYAYDYTDAPMLGNRVIPRKVTVIEAGKVVAVIHVDSVGELSEADPKLFVAGKEMKWAAISTAAQKLFVYPQKGFIAPDATIQPVCVFGLVTPEGKLVEAHSMQPSDPNSPAAVEYAKTINYYGPAVRTPGPEQHFVFIIEKFVAPQP
jgi:hypothetical protein